LTLKPGVRPKSLILVGRSRTGKTEWARSIGAHTYWNGYYDLESFNPDCKYAIFDDINTANWAHYKQWLGAQAVFTTTDKYIRKRQLVWGRPCILVSNMMPAFDDEQWINDNCMKVFIGNNSLF